MSLHWSLKELYSSFECQKFKDDLKEASKKESKLSKWIENNLTNNLANGDKKWKMGH